MLATVTCLVGTVHMRGAAFIVDNVSKFSFLFSFYWPVFVFFLFRFWHYRLVSSDCFIKHLARLVVPVVCLKNFHKLKSKPGRPCSPVGDINNTNTKM